MQRRRTFVLVMIIVLAIMLWGCQDNTEPQKALPKDTVTVDIDTSDIYYISAFSPYVGKRNIYIKDHKEEIDRLVQVIEGEYHYVDTYSIYGRSGDGAWGINFYDSNGDLIYTYSINYTTNLMWLATDNSQEFWRYEKSDGGLDFEWFLDFLETMWAETY